MNETHGKRRRWFSINGRSLQTLFVFVGVPLLWIGWQRMIRSDAEVEYARILRNEGWKISTGGPYDSVELLSKHEPQGWWRDVARQVLGERVLVVESSHFSGKDFHIAESFTSLQRLTVTNCQGLFHDFHNFRTLRELTIVGTDIKDLEPLAGLSNLNSLEIRSAQLRDLSPIARLKSLRKLRLHGTLVDKSQIEALQKALPNCEISHEAVGI